MDSPVKMAFTSFGLFLAVFAFFGVVKDAPVYADCGTVGHTSIHGYAGLIVDVRIRPYNSSSTIEAPASTRVLVETFGGTSSPPGNIVHLNPNGDEGIDNRVASREFTQIANSCGYGTGNLNVILGYGAASGGGGWALDCDYSLHPSYSQKFKITGVGAPVGFRADTTGDAYGWSVTYAAPQNGSTSRVTIVYNEPPPPPPPGGAFSFNLRPEANCSSVRGYAYFRSSAVGQRISAFRIDGPGGVVVQPWRNTGDPSSVPPSADATVLNNVRFQVVMSPALVNQLWGSGGTVPLTMSVRYATFTTSNTFDITFTDCSNSPPSGSLTANCERLTVNGLQDPNYPSVPYRYRVYEIDASNNQGAQVGGGDGTSSGTFSVALNATESNNVNNGFRVVLEIQDVFPSGSAGAWQSAGTVNTGPCFAATCQLVSVSNPIDASRPFGVKAGQTISATVVLTNTGSSAIPANTFRAAYDYPAGNRVSYASSPTGPIPKGGTATAIISTTAPAEINSWAVYPFMNNFFALGGACGTIDTFVEFDLQPHSVNLKLTPDEESPTGFEFDSNAEKTKPVGKYDVSNVSVVRTVLNKTTGAQVGGPFNDKNATILTSKTYKDTGGLPGRDTAAQYCGTITVSPAAGWTGPGGARIVTVPSRTDEGSCARIVNKPYVRTYGGDVVAGAAFPDANGACTVTNADVKANTRPNAEQGSKSGSGSQLAVFAPGRVEGFFTAMLRTPPNPPTLPIGLTFGGTMPAGTSLSPFVGGSYLGEECLDDYYTTRQSSDPDDFQNFGGSLTVDPKTLTTNRQSKFSGNVTLKGGNDIAVRHSMFVDGDLFVENNVTTVTNYAGSSANIASLRIFVKGNVYISNAVTALDATIVAQPRSDNTGGVIYTCGTAFAEIADPAQRYSNCGNKLVVHGSFVANKVVLGRTFNTLANSASREGRGSTNAAEVFVFSPEVYLSNSAVRATSNPTSGDYQFIATLPPIL